MTGVLIYDAIDTASLLINVIWLWCVVLAFVTVAAIYTVILTGAVTWHALRKGVTGAWRAAHRFRGPQQPPAPSWARTESPSYDEAA
ncbi:hypothetical protein [Streptomyces sp. SAS_275]|uniref:hypothetical protein n=1 Tax=Streptomyces sp. SAS_275 TaxID=3412746 RepID=UPI00403D3583